MATLELLQSSITRTILNNDNCKLCHIVATLLQRVMNQIDFFTKKTTKKSITHQCDIALRKLVGSMVKEESKKELGKQALKLYAEKCNVKREKF